MSSRESLLELRGVGFSYTQRKGQEQVLDDISFDLAPGESCALMGPSGIGKTTLARICAGICRPTAGEVLFRGRRLLSPSSAITVSFQNYPCFPWLNVERNLLFGLEETGRLDREHREYAFWLLARVGLAAARNKYPRELSGGMSQRLSIARCLAVIPDVLILDEPFSALDRSTKTSLIELLLELQDVADFTLVVVLHDLADAYSLVDRAVVLAGRPARVTADLAVSGHDLGSFERVAMEAMLETGGAVDQRGDVLSLLSSIRARQIPGRMLLRKALEGPTSRLLGRRLGPGDKEFVLRLLEERETDRLRFGIRLGECLGELPEIQAALCRVWERPLVREARLDLGLALSRLPTLPVEGGSRLAQEACLFIAEIWPEFLGRVKQEHNGAPKLSWSRAEKDPQHAAQAFRLLAEAIASDDLTTQRAVGQWLEARRVPLAQYKERPL